jgi:hypothetical protein
MGIRKDALDRLEIDANLISQPNNRSMLELGCQNIYASGFPEGTIAQDYWKEIGLDITTWDILACNKAIVKDLRLIIPVEKKYDIVTNYGTLEHVEGTAADLYTAFFNVHTHCKMGGLMFHEFPLVNHWPNNEGHWGYHWWQTTWVKQFADECGYDIISHGIQYAMENYDTGGLIYCTLQKTEAKFISLETFTHLYDTFLTHFDN